MEKIIDVRDLHINTFSFNKNSNTLEKKRIAFIWKIKTKENLLKVICKDGKEITVTPEHKFLVSDINYKIIEKRGSELTKGDYIICPRTLDYEPIRIDDLESTILKKLLKDEGYIVKVGEEFKNHLHQRIIKEGRKKIWEKINSSLKFLSFYHCVWRGRYRLRDLVNIAELFDISDFELYQNIDCFNYRESFKKEFKNSVYIKLPKTYNQWKDFFYLIGLMWGDGDVNFWISNNDETIQKEIKRICNCILNVEPSTRIYGKKCPRIDLRAGLTFKKILQHLFRYPTKKKAHNIEIPLLIQTLPRDILAEFLKGYYDTDGHAPKRNNCVSITSASETMIKDLQLALLKFGILSTIYKKIVLKDKIFVQWGLDISGKYSLTNFRDNIGFKLEYKKQSLEQSVKSSELSIKADYIPYKFSDLTFKKRGTAIDALTDIQAEGLLLEISEKNVFLNEIREIKEVENKQGLVYDFTIPDNHNFIAEGMIIHNTTFSDNLLAGAGLISEELAGKQLALDFHEDEQTRGITIDAANVSMVHDLEGQEYLINLIDTPGHIDFSGDVTRAMRAVDGAIVLCCAVEEIMPQTETVLRQALKERVKPVLFINKVDRLIKEVKLTPEVMQQKFVNIINEVNRLIEQIAPDEFKQKWKVSIQEGSVAFGSAFHKWAVSFSYMQKTGLTFKEIIDAYQKDDYKYLAKKAPLHQVILNMVVKHHPNPIEAQKYRIPKIWHGDLESEEGKSLLNCDPNGITAFVVTKIVVDKHAGEISAGRLFSGTLKQGDEVVMNMAKRNIRIQQVSIYKGAQRLQVDQIPAGNICGIVGLKDSFAGETVSSRPLEPFEALKHLFEPVVTKSIEAKNPADLAKLVEVLKTVHKEDPTLFVEINEETGENLISGMGELHLEIIENRIKSEKGLQVVTSPPIVVFRETVVKQSGEAEGKSPNKHNKFYFIVEPLEDSIYKAIKAGELPEMRIKKKDMATFQKLAELGMSMKDTKQIREIYKGNMLLDQTRGEVHIGEVIELVLDAFEQVMDGGPLAREPCNKLKVSLMDTKLHEDAIHRGPAQVYPAVREGIRGAMAQAKTVMFEPLQVLQIEAPSEYMGELSKLVANKRGQLLSMDQHGDQLVIKARMPVAEMFGLASDLRSATGGRGNYFIVDQVFEKLPEHLQEKIVQQIRQRKGLGENE